MPKRSIPVPVIVAGELFAIALYLLGYIPGGFRALVGVVLGVPAGVLFIFYLIWGGEDRWWGSGWSLFGLFVSSIIAGMPVRASFAVLLIGLGVILVASYLSGR